MRRETRDELLSALWHDLKLFVIIFGTAAVFKFFHYMGKVPI